MNDEIKQIAALIGHQQAQEKRVNALIAAFEKEAALLHKENEHLSRTIAALGVSSDNITDAVRQSVRSAISQVTADLKQAGLESQKPAASALTTLVSEAQQSVSAIRREINFFSWKSALWTVVVLLFLFCCSVAGLGYFLTTGYDRIDAMQAKKAEWERKAPLANISTCDDKPCVQVTGNEYTNKKGDRFYLIKPVR
ncbi:tRNA modification GTPase [Providencia rustigianii]|uniref:tRNA modification GTPase n=1 Tax=Providencia rustigianii TaxID=158850 RepID=UPI00223F38A8|nr:tRNA modification GTPase [Providencia rustigianii]